MKHLLLLTLLAFAPEKPQLWNEVPESTIEALTVWVKDLELDSGSDYNGLPTFWAPQKENGLYERYLNWPELRAIAREGEWLPHLCWARYLPDLEVLEGRLALARAREKELAGYYFAWGPHRRGQLDALLEEQRQYTLAYEKAVMARQGYRSLDRRQALGWLMDRLGPQLLLPDPTPSLSYSRRD